MAGPAGRSHCSDPNSPAATDTIPTRVAAPTIRSGVVAMRRAAAAGTMTSATTSSMPTIFMPTAITAASRNTSSRRTRSTGTPSTAARSLLTVTARRLRHCQAIAAVVTTAVPNISHRSTGPTERMSPKR